MIKCGAAIGRNVTVLYIISGKRMILVYFTVMSVLCVVGGLGGLAECSSRTGTGAVTSIIVVILGAALYSSLLCYLYRLDKGKFVSNEP